MSPEKGASSDGNEARPPKTYGRQCVPLYLVTSSLIPLTPHTTSVSATDRHREVTSFPEWRTVAKPTVSWRIWSKKPGEFLTRPSISRSAAEIQQHTYYTCGSRYDFVTHIACLCTVFYVNTPVWISPYARPVVIHGEQRYSSLILNLGTHWRRVFSFTLRPLYIHGKSRRYRRNRGLCEFQMWTWRFGEGKISCLFVPDRVYIYIYIYIGMRRITTFRSTTDRIYEGGPIRLWFYNIIF